MTRTKTKKDPAPSLLTTWRGVDEWELEQDAPGNAPKVVPKYSYGYVCNYHYTCADFAQIHPLLPEALSDYFLEVLNTCPGGVIDRMLDYWNQEIMVLPDAAFYGDSGGYKETYYIGAIHRMAEHDGGLDISFDSHAVRTTPSGLKYATNVEKDNKTLDDEWLDLHHAGWQERLLAASALGLTPAEMQRYLFRPALPMTLREIHLPMDDMENHALTATTYQP